MSQYQLPITAWSATDYSYLVNNNLGWVSDDEKFWKFHTPEKMEQFRQYLQGRHS